MGSKVEAGPDIDNGGDKLDRRLSQGCEVVRDSNATVEGPGPSEEGVSKIAGDFIGCKGARSIQLSLQGNLQNGRPPPTIPPSHSLPSFSQHPQPQPPVGPLVRWERFLPIQALKVLLVENDDSTRHVVSALLRNCSYEVKTAANGLEAWKFLEDSNNHVDLVLSEVAMPGLSGIGLLSKIMSHATCKHTPVIMMSSYDSMGLVFKCLTKGAVDFLVKPIRKNELKNLWQHVWRRCHSSSGSGSESGIRAPSLGKPTSFDESDGSSGSNDEDSDSSIGLNARDGSDVGSGTQSSWTKRAAEIESPQPASQQDHLLDSAHDSTCAQVIRPKTETVSDDWIPMSDDKNRREKDLVDGESLGKDLEEEMPKDASTHVESFPREKIHPSITGQSMEFATEGTVKNNQKSGAMEQESIKVTCERSAQAADLFGAFGNTINSQIVSKSSKASNDTPDILASKDMAGRDVTEINTLEFNLKGPISARDDATASNRNILRHSNHSAFSRYNVSTSSCQISAAFGETNEVTYHTNKELKKTNGCIRSPPLTEKSKTILAAKDTHLSAFSPVRPGPSGTEEVFQEKADDIDGATAVQSKGIHVQVEHHHHHYHHHHIHGMQNQPQLQHPGHQQPYELKNITSTVPQCGSSNVYGGQIECNTVNCSVNGSASGSNHGSNVLNVSSAAANAVGINKDESGAAAKGGGEDNNGSAGQSGSAIDHTRSAQREAALNKFRQKRKERCFEKKVRYQSRKKLAEQRPRLHGQFVRITTHEEDQDKSH